MINPPFVNLSDPCCKISVEASKSEEGEGETGEAIVGILEVPSTRMRTCLMRRERDLLGRASRREAREDRDVTLPYREHSGLLRSNGGRKGGRRNYKDIMSLAWGWQARNTNLCKTA